MFTYVISLCYDEQKIGGRGAIAVPGMRKAWAELWDTICRTLRRLGVTKYVLANSMLWRCGFTTINKLLTTFYASSYRGNIFLERDLFSPLKRIAAQLRRLHANRILSSSETHYLEDLLKKPQVLRCISVFVFRFGGTFDSV